MIDIFLDTMGSAPAIFTVACEVFTFGAPPVALKIAMTDGTDNHRN